MQKSAHGGLENPLDLIGGERVPKFSMGIDDPRLRLIWALAVKTRPFTW
jgi:hypothetical protein